MIDKYLVVAVREQYEENKNGRFYRISYCFKSIKQLKNGKTRTMAKSPVRMDTVEKFANEFQVYPQLWNMKIFSTKLIHPLVDPYVVIVEELEMMKIVEFVNDINI